MCKILGVPVKNFGNLPVFDEGMKLQNLAAYILGYPIERKLMKTVGVLALTVANTIHVYAYNLMRRIGCNIVLQEYSTFWGK